jgi:soluble lytic murein transglycosylase-like protein
MSSFLITFGLAMNSMMFNLPPNLLSSVCWVESTHRPHVIAYDDGGSASYGLCQVKYATAKALGFKGDKSDLLNAGVNSYYAAKILKYHINQCKTIDAAILAYSSGRCGRGRKSYLSKVKRGAHDKTSGSNITKDLEDQSVTLKKVHKKTWL